MQVPGLAAWDPILRSRTLTPGSGLAMRHGSLTYPHVLRRIQCFGEAAGLSL